MKMLNIEIIDSFDRWGTIASQWNQLLGESLSATIFLTWEWMTSWAECCLGQNRHLFILVFYEEEQIIGIAPFYIEETKVLFFSIREICFLGTPEAGYDYLDVFTKRGKEKIVADALYDFLMKKEASVWNQLRLHDIPSDSLFLQHYTNNIKAEGKYFEITKSSYCPFANLKPTLDEYFSELSPKRKQRLNQKRNILNRHGNVIHNAYNNISDHIMDDFFDLYENKSGWSPKYVRPILANLLKKFNENKNIQIDLLSVDGRIVAGLVLFKYNNTISQYLMASDRDFLSKASVGNILIGNCINNAIESGFKVYDMLKGESEYKFHWATDGRSSVEIRFWQRKIGSLCSAFNQMSRNALKLLLR